MLLLFVAGLWGHVGACRRRCRRRSCRTRTRATSSPSCRRPPGASLEYTDGIAKQAEKIIFADPDIARRFSVMGFSFSGAAPEQRPDVHRAQALRASAAGPTSRSRPCSTASAGRCSGIPGALVVPFAPPAIQGLSVFGGFQFEVLDQTGGDITGLADGDRMRWSRAGNQSGRVAGLFSSFRANDPQLRRRHRPRPGAEPGPADARGDRRAAGLPRVAVRQRLRLQQPRLSRVTCRPISASAPTPEDLQQLYARADDGRDGAARHGRAAQRDDGAAGDQPLQPVPLGRDHRRGGARAQLGRGARGDGGDGARGRCRRASTSRGRDSRSRRSRPARRPVYIFALSVLLVYLVLAAQYESWVLPFIILLGVPLAVFGALGAQLLRGFANDVFCQVGLVHARRPGGEELDSDRRVRRAAARAGPARSSTRRSRRRASACGRF